MKSHIKQGEIYQVDACLDVNFYVKKITHWDHDHIGLKVNYVYRNPNLGVITEDNHQYKLSWENSKRWKKVLDY